MFGFWSCSKKSLSDFLSDFSLYEGYIESFSSGYVSVYDPITVTLAQDLSPDLLENGPQNKWFSISPSVDGEVKFLDANTIQFVPTEKLKQDQEYRITFQLHKVMDVPKDLREFRFAVHTYKQDFIVNINDIQSYDRNWQYLRGSIETTDLMEFEIAKQLVTAEQEGKKLNVKVVRESELSRSFSFVIDSVQRKMEDSKVTIFWDGKPFKIVQQRPRRI